MAQEKYLNAIRLAADGFPIILPSFGADLDLTEMLDQLDGWC